MHFKCILQTDYGILHFKWRLEIGLWHLKMNFMYYLWAYNRKSDIVY